MTRVERQVFVHLGIGVIQSAALLCVYYLVEHPGRWLNPITFAGLTIQIAAMARFQWQTHRLGRQDSGAIRVPLSKS